MHRTRQARVEGADHAPDLDRPLTGDDLEALERLFQRAGLAGVVPRRAIPRRGDHALVMLDLPVLDREPVAQGPARGLHQAEARAALDAFEIRGWRAVRLGWVT